MKKIRVGIIGQGRSGRDIHGVYLHTDPRFQIVAVTDALVERRQRAAREYGCETYVDYREMLRRRDLDLVVNASYSHLHAPLTLAILRSGRHVLCEKPLAHRMRDVDGLIAAARKAGKVLAIFQQSRFAPYFQQVRKVLDSGVLGRIVQISIQFNGFGRRWDWQTVRACNGGSLLNTGPHPLDQALQLFGDGMPQVSCFMDRTDGSFGDAENHVKVILRGKGHPLIDMEISSCCPYPGPLYNIYGTRGGLRATSAEMEWKYFKWPEAPKQKLTLEPLRDEEGKPAYPQEGLTWHTGKWPEQDAGKGKSAGYSAAAAPTQGGMTGAFYSMLHKTLTRRAPLLITPEQVRRQVAVIEECQRQNPQVYR